MISIQLHRTCTNPMINIKKEKGKNRKVKVKKKKKKKIKFAVLLWLVCVYNRKGYI